MKNKIIMIITLFLMIPFTVSASLTPISEEFDLYEEMSVVEEQQEDIYTVPILGEVDARNVSLPILAMVMGAVDGFNPCAMWILIFLITMLLNIPDKRKRWVLGLAFILTSGVVYLFLMLAWLNVAVYVAQIHLIRLVISIFAIGFGMFSLYKYVKSLQETEVGCDVTTQKQRNKIMQKIRKVVSQKSFALAVIGIIAVSASVNLLEALCSLGLPLIFTQILAINELTSLQHAFYIGLYILFFVLNELIIFVIAMVTMNIKGISNKYAKYSNLIGGIIMLLLGLLMALRPEWLMFSF